MTLTGYRGAGTLVSHKNRGADSSQRLRQQYLSIRCSEKLTEANIDASVGSVGDSYDNAVAETINDL